MRKRMRWLAALAVLTTSLAGARTQGVPRESEAERSFHRHTLLEPAPDVRRERLCREALTPDSANDRVWIDCVLETGTLAEAPPRRAEPISIVAFNVERGRLLGRQLQAFRQSAAIRAPDVLLLTELDRGCSRTQYMNTPREYAEVLGMNYVFGVEFLELPRPRGAGGIETVCEHGNAILSRFPIEEPRLIRFGANRSWYLPRNDRAGAAEPRLGGRMAITATLRVGGQRVQAYAFHLESGLRDGAVRHAQAMELLEDALRQPFLRVIGGDSNLHAYGLDLALHTRFEPAVARFEEAGLRDVHRGILPLLRPTHRALVVIDLILSDADVESAGIASWATWGGLSDHLPVWAQLRLPAAG